MASNHEIFIAGSPMPFSIKETDKILNQMKKSVCKICLKGKKKGTGFFCNIPYLGQNLKVLITNNHVINEDYYKSNKEITFSCLNDKYIFILDLTKKKKKLFQ